MNFVFRHFLLRSLLLVLFCLLTTNSTTVNSQVVEEGAASQWWYGEMKTPARTFRFAVSVQPSETGKWSATLVSLDEGRRKFPLSNVSLSDTEFRFELTATKAKFEGKREADAKTIAGTWQQGPAKLPLKFREVAGIPEDQPAEVWVSDLEAGLQKLKLQIRIYHDEAGKSTAYFDSLSQDVGGFHAEWSAQGEDITAKIPAINGSFKGKLDADGQLVAGEWTQGAAYPLVWKKAEAVAPYVTKVLKRPQHPQGDPPYRVESVRFPNDQAGIELAGTLTYPGDPKAQQQGSNQRFPVAILISGSGPQDRDETILGHKPFLVLADHLTRAGIAVLRFDERGVGESTGQYAGATSQDFADDVSAAITFLNKHPVIDTKQIGLIGHSEGGIVAPLVATSRPEVAWIVMLAGPGVNGEEILYSQGKLIVAAAGGSEQDTMRQRVLQEVVFAAMKKIAPEGQIDEHIAPTTDQFIQQLKSKLVERGELKSADEAVDFETPVARQAITAMVKANLEQMHNPWFRFFATHEPAPLLEKLRCPVLALNGERDVQVDPKLNLPKIEAALKVGGHPNSKVMELPQLNHLFQTAKTGSLAEYELIEETFAPAALQVITDWILQQAGRQ